MYLTSQCGDSRGYFPINTKWGGTSTLTGLLPGGGLRGYFRPNFAMARGNYPGGGHAFNSGLGDLTVDPSLLGIGIGALALGMFLFGRKHPKRARKRGRLRRALRELKA